MGTARTRAVSRWPDLLTGFDSLTLDPSPRLRRARQNLTGQHQDPVAAAWRDVGRALADAMISAGRTLIAAARQTSRPLRHSR